MKAQAGHTYAQINGGNTVFKIFTQADLPEWADVTDQPLQAFAIQVIDVTAAIPNVGDTYNPGNGTFTPPGASAAQPAATAFMNDLIGLFTLAVWNGNVLTQFPWLVPAITGGRWADVQALIIAANTGAKITPLQYTSIKNFVLNRNIPIVLP